MSINSIIIGCKLSRVYNKLEAQGILFCPYGMVKNLLASDTFWRVDPKYSSVTYGL